MNSLLIGRLAASEMEFLTRFKVMFWRVGVRGWL